MSTALEDVDTGNPADTLRATTAAVRVSFTWFGTRKTLNPEQKNQAAETFGAEGQYLSAGKKLLDTAHPAFKLVTGVKTAISGYWKSGSLPYVEPGIRLIKQADVDGFNERMRGFRNELLGNVLALDMCLSELIGAARVRLGSLFNEADYPASLVGLFDVEWDFPSVEPPDYLRSLNPELYAQESRRVAARFDEAVALAESAFTEELAKLVSHLTERLADGAGGFAKTFKDSAVDNLRGFFERFRHLNITGNQQLETLVGQLEGTLGRLNANDLRTNRPLRQQVASRMAGVASVLDGLMVDRPRRKLLRKAKAD